MKKTRIKKPLSFFLCFVLIAAIALLATGCGGNKKTDVLTTSASTVGGEAIVMGTGETKFNFSVTYPDGVTADYIIQTDKTIVGEALEELNLISGDEGPYGLYVKTVNGVNLDYDIHGMYWAFYENGSYAAAGVDKTEIDPSVSYSFAADKG